MIKDLTVGRPEQVLRRFTLPLFISVIAQQLYNMADSFIVGKFAANGEDAVAAIGASYPITMIFMAVAIGSNIGCSVVISQLFGAKQYARMKTAVSTTLTAAAALALVLTLLGLGVSTPLMRMVNTPENIFGDAQVYFNNLYQRICFSLCLQHLQRHLLLPWRLAHAALFSHRFIHCQYSARLDFCRPPAS